MTCEMPTLAQHGLPCVSVFLSLPSSTICMLTGMTREKCVPVRRARSLRDQTSSCTSCVTVHPTGRPRDEQPACTVVRSPMNRQSWRSLSTRAMNVARCLLFGHERRVLRDEIAPERGERAPQNLVARSYPTDLAYSTKYCTASYQANLRLKFFITRKWSIRQSLSHCSVVTLYI